MSSDPEPNPSEVMLGGMEVLEAMKSVLDMLEGYKAELARRGYSESAQEQMAMDLHRSIMMSRVQ